MSTQQKKQDFGGFCPEAFQATLDAREAREKQLMLASEDESRMQLVKKILDDRATTQLKVADSLCCKFLCFGIFLVTCVVLFGHASYHQYKRAAFLESADAVARSIRTHPMFRLEWRKGCLEKQASIQSELTGFRAGNSEKKNKKKGLSYVTDQIFGGSQEPDESSFLLRLEILMKTADEIVNTPVENFNKDQKMIYNQVEFTLLSAHSDDVQYKLDRFDEGVARSMPANVLAHFIRNISDVTIDRLSYVHVVVAIVVILVGIRLSRPTDKVSLIASHYQNQSVSRPGFRTVLMVVMFVSVFVCIYSVRDSLSYLTSFFL